MEEMLRNVLLMDPFMFVSVIYSHLDSHSILNKIKALKSIDFRALELLARFELATSSLPRMRSTG